MFLQTRGLFAGPKCIHPEGKDKSRKAAGGVRIAAGARVQSRRLEWKSVASVYARDSLKRERSETNQSGARQIGGNVLVLQRVFQISAGHASVLPGQCFGALSLMIFDRVDDSAVLVR
jgi:hypothetical protein